LAEKILPPFALVVSLHFQPNDVVGGTVADAPLRNEGLRAAMCAAFSQ
jgi:hypothetical protein